MSAEDNSVNIEDDKGRYHHGDLRAALVAEGMRQLAGSDAEHLSLREIARNVGVSPTAVYRHFPDKQALLMALADEGGAMLVRRQAEAQEAAGGGARGFEATGRAYVRFALDNPALFRLMTSRLGEGGECDDGPRPESGLGLLRSNIAALLPTGTGADMQRVHAVRSWATVHGLAMLMLDGQIAADEMLIDHVVSTAGASVLR